MVISLDYFQSLVLKTVDAHWNKPGVTLYTQNVTGISNNPPTWIKLFGYGDETDKCIQTFKSVLCWNVYLVYLLHVSATIVDKVYNATCNKDKGKVHPRTGHKGPKREQRYNSTLSLTLVLGGSGRSTPLSDLFIPGKIRYLLYRRLGGTQGWFRQVGKISPPRPHQISIPGPPSP
jgi:hypothetical protein